MELDLKNSLQVMNREQIYYILGAIILVAILFLGFSTKPSTQKALEKSRVLNTQKFDIQVLQEEAKKDLSKDEITYIEALTAQEQFAGADSTKIRILKELSGYWFQLKRPLMAGYYARQVAELEQSATSWSIAGTTFASALANTEIEEKNRILSRDQAIESFENAISLEPDVIEHRVNQALCYIETPDVAQPMKGVQMLASLATNYPGSAIPAYHLARLAVKTGQLEKAEERIDQALNIDSTNTRAACLAIDIYTAVGKPDKARKWAGLCNTTK